VNRYWLPTVLLLASTVQAAEDFTFTSAGPTVYAPAQAALDLTNEVTLEAWLMPQATAGRVLDKGVPGAQEAYMLDTYPGNALRMITAKGILGYAANLPTNQWSHVAGVYSMTGRVMAMYLNGAQVAISTNGAFPPMTITSNPLQVGADPTLANKYLGRMLRMAVYGRALSSNEIAQRATSPLTNIVSLAGAVGEWVATNQVVNVFPSIGSGSVSLLVSEPDSYPPSTIPIGDQSADASRHNVTWHSASTTGSKGSMPLGNGDIALNAWVEQGGDLVFYISKTDAFDDSGRLCKVGRVRVRFTPAVFSSSLPYEQTLDVQRGEMRVTAGPLDAPVTVKLWVDANQPAIHVETVNAATGRVDVLLENLRPTLRNISGSLSFSDLNYNRSGATTYSYPDAVATGSVSGIVWYHHNATSLWRDCMTLQQIPNPEEAGLVDPYLHRIFGGWIEGAGFTNASPTQLVASASGGTNAVAIHILTETNSSPSQWLLAIESRRNAAAAIPPADAYASHLAWWSQFWQRSWIHIGSSVSNENNSAWTAALGYALQRYITACAGRGAFPIKFNGSLFTVEYNGDPDYRRWGPGYWMQNTRLPYWALFQSGDLDFFPPLFNMYSDTLAVRRQIASNWFGHAGSYIPETMNIHGLLENDSYGWNIARTPANRSYRQGQYIRYEYVPLIELGWMMSDYADYTGDTNFLARQALPTIDDGVRFYHEHFKVPRDGNDYALGTQEVYQATGQYIIYPASACETWWMSVNPAPDVAGWRVLMRRLLSLDPWYSTPEQRAYWENFSGRLPDVPIRSVGGRQVLGFAQTPGSKGNSENPELYSVFPFRLYGLGRPGLDLAIRTYANRETKATGGWYQDAIDAALLGQASDAKAYVVQNYSTKDATMRFPAFWGPNFDWTPDQDHGSVANIALQRMVAQWDAGQVRLLPAWPRIWDVDFKSHGPGGATVHCVYRDGAIQTLEVTPTNLTVILPTWSTATGAVWTGAGNGSWANATNWLSSQPAAGDNVIFDYRATSQRATTLAGNTTIRQLAVADPPGAISIGNNTLTLAEGIDMSLAQADLTIGSAVSLSADQAWSVGAGRTLAVSGGLTGAVVLVKAGPGTQALNGTVAAGVGVVVDDGTLTLGASGGFQGNLTIGANATVLNTTYHVFGNKTNQSLHIDGGTLMSGGLEFYLPVDVRMTGGRLLGSDLRLDPGGGAFIIHAASTTATIDANVRIYTGGTMTFDVADGAAAVDVNLQGGFGGDFGGGTTHLVKDGPGLMQIAAAAAYTGATTVSNGTLLVAGSLGNTAVTVDPAGTLGGAGTIRGPVTVNGALAPGSSVGTLTISNNLALAAGAELTVELGTNSDSVRVAGNLTLGGSLDIADAGGFGTGVYTLVSYAGVLTDNGLVIGAVPGSVFVCALDTSAQGQVRLNVSLSPFGHWLVENFGSLTNSAAAPGADPDGDGLNNDEEFRAGTQPTNSASVLQNVNVAVDANGFYVVTWDSVGGKSYRVQYSDGGGGRIGTFDDIPGEFADTNSASAPGTLRFTDDFTQTGPPLTSNRYFRVRVAVP
jgi:alpha-L-fucosidase 2